MDKESLLYLTLIILLVIFLSLALPYRQREANRLDLGFERGAEVYILPEEKIGIIIDYESFGSNDYLYLVRVKVRPGIYSESHFYAKELKR